MRNSLLMLLCFMMAWPLMADQVGLKQGTFSQEKHFKGFTKPFISEGLFKLTEQGIIWQVESPIKSKLVIKQGQVYTYNERGEAQLQKGAEPYVALLQAIIKHDKAALALQFDTREHADNDCQLLLPNDEMLQQIFSQFTVCADEKNVNSVRLQEINGNVTLLRFSYPQDGSPQ
ncbi:outer membrane lipoprotein carrier protein LolA [Pseudoalteromonas lipolytica]